MFGATVVLLVFRLVTAQPAGLYGDFLIQNMSRIVKSERDLSVRST